jgi:hypothetical protein
MGLFGPFFPSGLLWGAITYSSIWFIIRGQSCGFTSENGKKGVLGTRQGWLAGFEERPENSG